MKQLVLDILRLARETEGNLGEAGRQEVYGPGVVDISTRSDLAVSEAVLAYLKRQNIPGIFLDEEMIKERGPIHLTASPKYTIAFDDLDGTDNHKRGRGKLPVVSIITIFDSLKPRYRDALAAGIIDVRDGNVWFAERGKGLVYIENGVEKPAHTSGREVLDRKTLVCLDHYGSEDPSRFSKLYPHAWVKDFGAAGFHFAGVASGMFDAFVNLKNKAHETGSGYLLVKEGGGWFADLDGNPYDHKTYDFNSKEPVISAATEKLGRRILELVGE